MWRLTSGFFWFFWGIVIFGSFVQCKEDQKTEHVQSIISKTFRVEVINELGSSINSISQDTSVWIGMPFMVGQLESMPEISFWIFGKHIKQNTTVSVFEFCRMSFVKNNRTREVIMCIPKKEKYQSFYPEMSNNFFVFNNAFKLWIQDWVQQSYGGAAVNHFKWYSSF